MASTEPELRDQRAGMGKLGGRPGKGLGLSVLFGAPVMLLFNWIVKRWPRRYWLGIWVVTLPLLVLAIFGSPLLEPIFNKFEPLQKNNPALVTELEKVVARTGTNIPPERMFLMKASVKTNGLNAYVSGIGRDEADRGVGYDSGTDSRRRGALHLRPRERPLRAAPYSQATGGDWRCSCSFSTGAARGGWMARRLVERLGRGGRRRRWRAGRDSWCCCLTISIASFFLQPIGNAFSRHFEHEADVYGQEAMHGHCGRSAEDGGGRV